MKVKVRTPEGFRLSLPVPVGMIGGIVRLLPNRMFEQMQRNTPEPYAGLVSKQTVCMILGECLDVLRENKGLEVIHVEARDGTFVSIRL